MSYSPSDKDTEKTLPVDNGRLTPDGSPLGVLQLIETHEKHHPVHWSPFKKWPVAIAYCALQVFVTILSTSYISAEFLVAEQYGGSTQVIALGQSLFIVGTAVGPAFLGPLSDINGRKWIYVASILCYAILQIVSLFCFTLQICLDLGFLGFSFLDILPAMEKYETYGIVRMVAPAADETQSMRNMAMQSKSEREFSERIR